MTDTIAKTIQLTKDGLEDLQKELTELVEVKLPAVVARVAKAREQGDLSENAEYSNAREDQTLIEARIAEIERILERAQVVAATKSHTKVGIGSKLVVTLKGKKNKKMTLLIVGEFEADPQKGKVSAVSPLGKALMGKAVGDQAVVKAPAGEIIYTIVEIK